MDTTIPDSIARPFLIACLILSFVSTSGLIIAAVVMKATRPQVTNVTFELPGAE